MNHIAWACSMTLIVANCAVAAEPADRAQAVAATLANVKAEAAAQGGWDAWYAKLRPFREDLSQIVKTQKWPWAAKNNFRFYGQSARLLSMEGPDRHPEQQDPLGAIVSLDRQLKSLGVDLIVVFIPDKLAIYPDYLSAKTPADRMVFVQSKQLIQRLSEADVEAVDLFTPYHAYRTAHGDDLPLYYVSDGHWNNRGARLAAETIAPHLRRYDCVKKATAGKPLYDVRKGARTDGGKADNDLLHVLLKGTETYYKDISDSPIVLTGDSFSMYNMNTGAHLGAQVSRLVNMPLSYVCREGLAQDMPIELAKRQRAEKFLANRKVIIWTMRGRCLSERGWTTVDLSGTAAPQAMLSDAKATGEVAAVSQRPRKDAPYVNYIMELHVTGLVDAANKPIGAGEATVHVLAMRNREVLPIAQVQKGDKLQMRLTTWSTIKSNYDKINSGVLRDTDRAQFWAEVGDATTRPMTGVSN